MAANHILGISAYYHDSAAVLLRDGDIVAAVQEERFSRLKHDPDFPGKAIDYCLSNARIELTDLDAIVFYDKPLLKFERLLETYLNYAPRGFRSFAKAMPVWLKDKLYLKQVLRKELAKRAGCKTSQLPRLLFAEHHQSHAASAFYPSPFERAAVLCLDGVGEWATTTAWLGNGATLEPLWKISFPHSLGLLYSALTYFCGFKVNSGEYKLMGLAPYGEPRFAELMRRHLIDVKPDGTFRLDMRYFDYCTGLTMTNAAFAELFGGPARLPESPIGQREMDLAASVQQVTEDIVLGLGNALAKETGETNLCLAGGVALNCVANGRLLREGPFQDVWVQPAAGDAGGALGCALVAWHAQYASARVPGRVDGMRGAYLGPGFEDHEIEQALNALGGVYQRLDEQALCDAVADLLAQGQVVGWFQGRMEFGPRALGARSILADPRRSDIQRVMNQKIKFRESFRPFAPSVLEARASEFFEIDRPSPYMMFVAPVRSEHRIAAENTDADVTGFDRMAIRRSELPAITHVDFSARVQTVHAQTNPRFHRLLTQFDALTGCPLVVNTSFNVRGEPIVCTPEDAYRCLMGTHIDYLAIGSYLLARRAQPGAETMPLGAAGFALD